MAARNNPPAAPQADSQNVHNVELSIFAYTDYREFLKNYCARMKETTQYFSHRYFTKLAGLGSESYLRMVIKGERNLSPATISKFAKAMPFSKKEAVYFNVLVLYNQSLTDDEKSRYLEQVLSLRPRSTIAGLTRDQFEYLTNTLFVIIREMAALPDFKDDAVWIAQNLRRKSKPSEVQHALEVLERLKLLLRDQDGKLKHSGLSLDTPCGLPVLEMLNYHRQILMESKDAIMTAPYDEWDVYSHTIPVPKESLGKVSDLLRQCLDEITHVINVGSKNFNEVYQINIQMFPVTKTKSIK